MDARQSFKSKDYGTPEFYNSFVALCLKTFKYFELEKTELNFNVFFNYKIFKK